MVIETIGSSDRPERVVCRARSVLTRSHPLDNSRKIKWQKKHQTNDPMLHEIETDVCAKNDPGAIDHVHSSRKKLARESFTKSMPNPSSHKSDSTLDSSSTTTYDHQNLLLSQNINSDPISTAIQNTCGIEHLSGLLNYQLNSTAEIRRNMVPTPIVTANYILKNNSPNALDSIMEIGQKKAPLFTTKTNLLANDVTHFKWCSLDDLSDTLQDKRAKSNFSNSVARKKSHSSDRANLFSGTFKKCEKLTPSQRKSRFGLNLWYTSYKENKKCKLETSRQLKSKLNCY